MAKYSWINIGRITSALWQRSHNTDPLSLMTVMLMVAAVLFAATTLVPLRVLSATDTCQAIKATVKINPNKAERLLKKSGLNICAYYLALGFSKDRSQYAQDKARYWINYAYQFANRRSHPVMTADILSLRVYMEASIDTLDTDLKILRFLDEQRFKNLMAKKYSQLLPALRDYLSQPLTTDCPTRQMGSIFFQKKQSLIAQIKKTCVYASEVKSALKSDISDMSTAKTKFEELANLRRLANALLDEIRIPLTGDKRLVDTVSTGPELKEARKILNGWKEYHRAMQKVENAQTALEQMEGLKRAMQISRSLIGGRDPNGASLRYKKNRFLGSVLASVEQIPSSIPSMKKIDAWLNAREIRGLDNLKKTLSALKVYHSCRKSSNRVQTKDPCIAFFSRMSARGDLVDGNVFEGLEKLKERVVSRIMLRVNNVLVKRPVTQQNARLLAADYYRWTKEVLSALELKSLNKCIDKNENFCLPSIEMVANTSSSLSVISDPNTNVVEKAEKTDPKIDQDQKKKSARTSRLESISAIYWEPLDRPYVKKEFNIDLLDINQNIDDRILTHANRKNFFGALPSPWDISNKDAEAILENVDYLNFLGWDVTDLMLIKAKAHLITGAPIRARRLFMSWLKTEGLKHKYRVRVLQELVTAMKESGADGRLEN